MADNLDFLNNLGINPDSVTTAKFGDVVGDIVLDWLTELAQEDLPKTLKEKGFESGGGQDSDLASSTRIEVVNLNGQELKWNIMMSDYWKYVEYGRGATKVGGYPGELNPAIEKWIRKKGIDPVQSMKRINVNWKLPKLQKKKPALNEFDYALRSLSFIISRNIHKNGTIARFGYKGSKFVNITMSERLPVLTKRLELALGRRIEVSLKTVFQNMK